MFVDSSPGTIFDTTELNTPTIKQSGGNCQMKFYYHMFGTDLDVLTVYTEANGYRRTLWYRVGGTNENKWKKEQVYIGGVSNFKVSHPALPHSAIQSGYANLVVSDLAVPFFPITFVIPSLNI